MPWRTSRLVLIPGTYSAVHENDQGVFYKCPAGCVVTRFTDGPYRYSVTEGGFWLPNAANKDAAPRIFAYAGMPQLFKDDPSQPVTPGPVVVPVVLPRNASPVGAGIGAGIAGGIIGAFASPSPPDMTRIVYLSDPIPSRVELESHFRPPN